MGSGFWECRYNGVIQVTRASQPAPCREYHDIPLTRAGELRDVRKPYGGINLQFETLRALVMKIMIFLHGTILMHRNAQNRTREERVKQVLDGDKSLHDFVAYIPVGDVVPKLQAWKQQGAEIVYLSSHKKSKDVEKDKVVLQNYGFPDGQVFFRNNNERYNEIVERVLPDILIEDDCESIGGEIEMTYPHVRLELKNRIKSIVVKEFGGIDHLPDNISALREC
jgi:hypothetical protein